MSSDLQTSAVVPQKYSRYRSVRQTVAEKAPEPEPYQRDEKPQGIALKKSMSRYRRSGREVPTERGIRQTPVPLRMYPSHNQANNEDLETTGRPNNGVDETRLRVDSGRLSVGQQDPRQRREVSATSKRQDLEALQQENETGRVHTEQETARKMLEDQKRKDLERLDAELAAATAANPATVPFSPDLISLSKEKFTLFSRKRTASKATTTTSSGSSNLPTIKSNDPPIPIVVGGGGAVPGTDAPISAVNAGERRVLVRCRQSSINLPVTPNTTPVDLIYSAADMLSHGVIPSTAILLESYTQIGLERRLRRYEHVRDIMNSWDRDTQNAVVVQASDSPGFDHDLDSSFVPKERPGDTSVFMYHSQKPGKWSKRFITLLSSGQIFLSKTLGAKVTAKDSLSLCHLSDFDIYTPTVQQIRKNLKPPKKHCHAIKSQQKTTIFLNTENFVHFFCTDDQKLADKWYNAVQQWRSWYLVNQMGEGARSQKKKSTSTAATSHKQVSVEEPPYTIGTFSPLMDDSRLETSDDEEIPRQIPFHLRNSFIESVNDRECHPSPVLHAQPDEALIDKKFAPTGLLGRTYSQRQRAQRNKEMGATLKANSGPFTGGLLDSVRPTTSADADGDSAKGIRRPDTASPQRARARPLVELNIRPGEEMLAPQWKRGHRVQAPSGVPLVEVAGGVEERPHMRWGKDVGHEEEFRKGSLLERG